MSDVTISLGVPGTVLPTCSSEEAVRLAVDEREQELGRPLTDDEVAEIRRQVRE